MKTRKLFAGTNSAKGFYSLFENVVASKANRVYLLKGGPGTGKGFFMNTIAQVLEEEGFDLELFYCSSDSYSLDAVNCPRLGIALIDATFPHVQDATWPGCRDELICLGDFWNKDLLVARSEEIMAGGQAKAAYFAKAFRYFSAALALEENMAARNSRGRKDCSSGVEEILAHIGKHQKGSSAKPSDARHLFASALTPEGYVSHIKDLVQDFPKRYTFCGPVGTGKSEYLQLVLRHGELQGLQVEAFHYPLDPEKLLHILLPELGLAVLTATELEPLADLVGNGSVQEIITGDVDVALQVNAGDHKLFRELIDLGVGALQHAQASHIKVEDYFASSMDFSAVDALREKITAEILSYKNRS